MMTCKSSKLNVSLTSFRVCDQSLSEWPVILY